MPELQRLNFDKMDLSELFVDIQAKVQIPDTSQAQQNLKDKVKGLVNEVSQQKHKDER